MFKYLCNNKPSETTAELPEFPWCLHRSQIIIPDCWIIISIIQWSGARCSSALPMPAATISSSLSSRSWAFPFCQPSPITHSIVRHKRREGASLPPPWKGFQGLLSAKGGQGGCCWAGFVQMYTSACITQLKPWPEWHPALRKEGCTQQGLGNQYFSAQLYELGYHLRRWFYLLSNQTGLYSVQSHLYRAINYHFLCLPNLLLKELHCQGLSISSKTRVVPGLGYTLPYVSNPCRSLLVLSWNPVKAASTRINTRESLFLPIMESRDVKTLLIIWLELQKAEF